MLRVERIKNLSCLGLRGYFLMRLILMTVRVGRALVQKEKVPFSANFHFLKRRIKIKGPSPTTGEPYFQHYFSSTF
jgi:hypothetical protein